MPFTLAHPAAVLPMRRVLWFPGLVAGSIAPDVAYYLPVPGGPALTHSLAGLLGIDLLLGAALAALGHLCLALVPDDPRSRVAAAELTARVRSWRAGALAVASVAVGAATHLAWDSLTHTHGAAVSRWDVLREPVVGPHRLYNVIGYASSLGGLLLLGIVALRWYRRARPVRDGRWPCLSGRVRAWVLGGIAVGAAAGAGVALTDPVSGVSTYDWVRQFLVGAVQGAGLGFAVYALGWRLSRLVGPRIGITSRRAGRRRRPSSRPPPAPRR
ncbi:DUF4184 family protein [Pseudonocardia acaciae]|uniref:DUF4184 family protein n=1 Tax=Pseudonocardia acaciae TaxID=551276 RepID=UPI0007E8E0CD|nr:DUF4184 family protein [Pseudonocardia acaciae]